jgi:hypothetical protein
MAIDPREYKILCECDVGRRAGERMDSDFAHFDSLARKAGYASGIEAANNCVLWGDTVAVALKFLEGQLTEETTDVCNE